MLSLHLGRQRVAAAAASLLTAQRRLQCDNGSCDTSIWRKVTFSADGAKTPGAEGVAAAGPMRHFGGSSYKGIHSHVGVGRSDSMATAADDAAGGPSLSEAAAEFLASREHDEAVTADLWYHGYVPSGVYSAKKSIMADSSLEPEELQVRVAFLLQVAAEMQEVFDNTMNAKASAAAAGGASSASLSASASASSSSDKHPSSLTIDDINHVRYVAVIGARLLGDHGLTNRLIDAILATDPINIDAIEARIEVCMSGAEEMRRLRPMLNALRGYPTADPATGLVVESDVYEGCFSLIADVILTSMIAKVQANGEGACSVYFGKVVQTVAVELFPTTRRHEVPFALERPATSAADGSNSASAADPPRLSTTERLPMPNEFGMLISRLFDSLDEQLYHLSTFGRRDLKQCAPVLSAIVAMLKAFLSMEAQRYVPFPEAAGLMHLLRLQTALRLLRRDRECHAIGERLIRYYNKHRAILEAQSTREEDGEGAEGTSSSSSSSPPRFAEGSYAAQYQNALFQHVHDEVLESPEVKQPKAIRLIEAYPTHNVPWKILAFSLYLQGRQEDAVVACRKAIELLPSDATSVLFLGNLYLELKQHGLAEEIIANFKAMQEVDRLAAEDAERRGAFSSNDGEDGEGAAGDDENGNESLNAAAIAAAKAEIGAHTLTLEADERLKGTEGEANKQVRALHDEYLLQMRRAHMYSAKGLPPLLHTDAGDDVAFKEATTNPEFASKEYDDETKMRERVHGVEHRRESLRGIVAGNTARNIMSADRLASLDALKAKRHTFRNMGRRDN